MRQQEDELHGQRRAQIRWTIFLGVVFLILFYIAIFRFMCISNWLLFGLFMVPVVLGVVTSASHYFVASHVAAVTLVALVPAVFVLALCPFNDCGMEMDRASPQAIDQIVNDTYRFHGHVNVMSSGLPTTCFFSGVAIANYDHPQQQQQQVVPLMPTGRFILNQLPQHYVTRITCEVNCGRLAQHVFCMGINVRYPPLLNNDN